MDATRWHRNKKTQFRTQFRTRAKRLAYEPLPVREVVMGSIKIILGEKQYAATTKEEIRTAALASVGEIIGTKTDAMAARETRSGTRQVLP